MMGDRYRRLRHIQTLDPERDHTEICRIITRYEFPWDYRVGFEMSVLTDLLVPSISRVLAESRNFAEAGQKRFDDTMLFEYEMKRSGPDSAHGHDAVRVLNRIHRGYGISNEDFLYVLASQTLSPIEWIGNYGWRPLSEHEIRALVASARAQGRLMGLTGIPDDYEGFQRLLREQRAQRAAFDPANREVAADVLAVIVNWFPAPLRPILRVYVPKTIAALLPPELPPLLGLAAPPRWLTKVARAALRARGRLLRFLPPRPDSRPYRPKPRSYPRGWTVEDFGPLPRKNAS
ncbi:oxygenase MpaB family protein [Amycolatopsis pigmentata]|uniref:Oxygenase MpaB family protein n=1 Tax=Amycolatopsis pigmentata TaxID=450801 RepID=A0ABW5FJE4_9PSEU